MPGQTSQVVSLKSLVGSWAEKVHNEEKDADVRLGGFEDPPPGITGGVAQLIGAKVEQDSDGRPQVRFTAIAKWPVVFDGKQVEGMRLSPFPMPLYDMPNKKTIFGEPATKENNYKVFEHMVGAFLDRPVGVPFAQMDAVLKALEKAKPYIRWTSRMMEQRIDKKTGKPMLNPKTKKPYEPRVSVRFGGVVQWNPAMANGQPGSVQDNTGGGTMPATEEVTEPSEDVIDLDALVALASLDVEDVPEEEQQATNAAQQQLIQMALDAGHDQETVDGAEDWNAVKDLIESAGGDEGGSDAGDEGGEPTAEPEAEPEPEPEEPFKPAKGLACKWKPTDAKTGKPVTDPKTKKPLKAIAVEVLTISEKQQTVTLKNSTTGKTIPGADKLPRKIKWSELIVD